jgi:CMP-2-keto-3-deoxyoctulosonic acid synthetase
MSTNNKLLKSISTITLIADINQHGQEIKCEAIHVALNKSLISTAIIAVDCKF